MGALIHLADAIPAGPDADRVAYSVGRSLTATDFGRQGRYIDARLLDLAPASPGVVSGLAISPARFDAPDGSGLDVLTIGVGSGLGTDGRLVRVTTPLQVIWTKLLDLVTGGQALDDGAYFLLVRTVVLDGLEGEAPDPSAGSVNDPLLDIRRDSFVEPWLSTRLGPLPAGRSPAALALALNTLVGGLTADSVAAAVANGVPLALVLVQNQQAFLLSQAAGRMPADPNGLNAMLLAQVREAFRMALAEPGADPASFAWQTAVRARFRVLPGAGELPLGLLLSPEAATANCPFFPTGMAVFLQAIRASQVTHLLRKALGRPQLDLTDRTAEAVTLVLAIPDAAWTPSLLDMPRGDPVLAADIHLSYAETRSAQVAARQAWIAVYGGMSATVMAQPQAVSFLLSADAAAQNLSYLLRAGTLKAADLLAAADGADTPTTLLPWIAARIASLSAVVGTAAPPPAPLPAADAALATKQVAARGYQVVDAEPADANPSAAGHVPVESDDILQPLLAALPQGSDFANWSAAALADPPDPDLLQPLIDAGVVDPLAGADVQHAAIAALLALPGADDPTYNDTTPGALLRLALLQLFYEVFVRVTRLHEAALDSHGRLIALQRQHLDIMSTSVSALAGGIMPDGSGLSFARLIPFITYTAAPAATPAPTNAPVAATGGGTTSSSAMMAVRTFSPLSLNATSAFNAPMFSQTVEASSVVSRATVTRDTAAAPSRSTISNVLGRQTDYAQIVAQQAGAISQAPNFQYQPVQYATAAHITAGATLLKSAVEGVGNLRAVMRSPGFNITPSTSIPGNTATDEPTRYAGIVQTTTGLLADIDQVQAAALAIERDYLLLRDRIHALEARIAQATAALASARDTLRTAQSAAAKAAGDYAAAQQLVQEETARVAAAVTARHAALSAATGLFYVRELQTVVPRALPPQMPLIVDTPTDLVPGCEIDHAGPPASLQPFLDLVLEVPLSDWWHLRDHWVHLPDQVGVQRLGAMRAARLANRTEPAVSGAGAAAADLASLAGATHRSFAPLFRATISTTASLAATQQAAFTVFALPDIIALPSSILRVNAEALRHRVEAATGCLFETLTATPPSVRFAWSSMARDGTLPALDFAHWPVPDSFGSGGAATLRRLAALVNWMAGQLHSGSSATARTALANLVSAAVIAAAHGDPDDIVTGTVASAGGVPRPGLPIRIVLNRPPPIGTVLNLLDENHTVVGTLRVDDHDDAGTTASVLTSFGTATPTRNWSVATPGARAAWLPS